MTKIYPLITGLLLLSHISFCQTQNIEDQPIDSILIWLESNTALDSGDFHGIALRTISKASKQNNPKMLADLHTALASWHGYNGLYPIDSLLYHDRKALKYYIETNDSLPMAQTLRVMSIDLQSAGLLQEAQASVFKAIEIFEALNDKDGLANAQRSLAELFIAMNEPEKAIEYANQAFQYYERVENYSSAAISLLTSIRAFEMAEQYPEAQDAAKLCIQILREKAPDEIFALSRALSYKSVVSIKEGLLDQALRESTEAYDIVSNAVGPDRAISYAEGIADVLLEQEKYNEALDIYLRSIEDFGVNVTEYIIEILKKIYKCYYGMGDYTNALKYQEKYLTEKILLKDKTIANLKSEAVIKYETGKKDQAIAAQQKEIEQKNRIQWLGIGVLGLLLILLGSLLWNYRKNQKITKALAIKNAENEFLIKEIHHRVKNNLQILSSLLSLQSNYLDDSHAAVAIKEGRNRVESMGMIHQRLYTQDHRAAINLKEYIPDLCAYLSDSFLSEKQGIKILPDIDVELVDVETAIPIGLVINELITNSIKYAFHEKEEGKILVKTWVNETNQLCLLVEDNGQGIHEITNKKRSTNFGSELVQVLIKKLKGTLEQNTEKGYSTFIKFDRFELIAA